MRPKHRKTPLEPRICHCGKSFTPYRVTQTSCSAKCRVGKWTQATKFTEQEKEYIRALLDEGDATAKGILRKLR